jgi:DNA-binding NtrC family response regulator
VGLRQQKVQTIMIIEDEGDILHVYKDYFEKKGYTISASAPTANEALRDYLAYRPDLVIMDYRLPGPMNGLEAAEKILRIDPTARIIMITAYDNVKEEVRKNAFLNDRVRVMIKPVHMSRLVKAIASL